MIYVDLSAWYAAQDRDDPNHEAARAAFAKVAGQPVATSAVTLHRLAERVAATATATVAARNLVELLAAGQAGELTVLRPDADDEVAAAALWMRMCRRPGRTGGSPTFAQALDIVLMKRHRVRRVFTFDSAYRAAGLATWPA